jgi:predicted amidohydrolase
MVGVLVCEDVWDSAPARQARHARAQVLLVINAWRNAQSEVIPLRISGRHA